MDATRRQLGSPGLASTGNIYESAGWASEDELEHWYFHASLTTGAEDLRHSLPRMKHVRALEDSAALTFFSVSSADEDEPTHVTRSVDASTTSASAAHGRGQPSSSSDSGLSAQPPAAEDSGAHKLQPKSLDLSASRDMERDSASQLRAQMLSRRHVSLSTCSMVVSDAEDADSASQLDDEDTGWDSGGVWESAECGSHCSSDLCWLPSEGSWSMNPSSINPQTEASTGRYAASLQQTSTHCRCPSSCSMDPCSSSGCGAHLDSSQAASSPDMDIRMVWPVCVPMHSDGSPVNAGISAIVGELPSTPPQITAQPAATSTQHAHGGGLTQDPDATSPSAAGGGLGPGSVLVMAGSSMELLARTPIRHGLAHCTVPASRSYSLQGTSVFLDQAQPQAAPAGLPIRVLTLFATSAGDAGPAANVLCASPSVAKELNELFATIADDLLALETDPGLPHVQLRDVHGYTYLPGSGKCSSAARDVARHISHTFASPSHPAAAAQHRQGSIQQRLCSGAGGGARAPRELSSAQLSEQEREMCVRAWTKHFQPLLREVAYLLMCVPGAFSQRRDGSQAWDHHIYCQTLAGMVGFLEHHRCWHFLSGILQHANTIGVAFRHQGERISYESLSPPLLEQLLTCSLHDDITVQYLQQAPESAFGWQPRQSMDERCQRLGLRGSMDEVAGCSFGTALEACIASLHQCPDRDDAALEDTLAGEFKDWEERWLVKGFTGTSIEPIPEEEHSQDSASTVSTELDCMDRNSKSTDVFPWEVLALFISCVFIAMHYAYQFGGDEV